MNDFPVIRDLVMRTGLWDPQGANIASRNKDDKLAFFSTLLNVSQSTSDEGFLCATDKEGFSTGKRCFFSVVY